MCGICGFVGIRSEKLLEEMTASLAHRGPDGVGYYVCNDVGLGHRRLSIIDLEGGQQPMKNEDGSLAMICNGEIYNYQSLREELIGKGHTLRTKSDSEVIVHLYEDMGVDCLRRLVGMFAIALYDVRARRLFLARDRLGIKPLYYLHLPGRLLFASEIKALLRYEEFTPELDPAAVHEYLALRYVPGPGGLIKGIRKLPAGYFAVFDGDELRLERYWEPKLYGGPFDGTDEEYLEGFAEHFERSIRRRMISDVPLGAYLSAGLDSSTIVAAMAKMVSKPIRTFTVGFDYRHDEVDGAEQTARLLGCNHTTISCRAADVELLPKIIHHLDEPVGDPIVIPMYQLAREAKKHVTVILTGEGADETLGGYVFHKALLAGHRMARALPRLLRTSVVRPALAWTPSSWINLAFEYPADLGPRGKARILNFLGLLEPSQMADAYRHLISLFEDGEAGGLYTEDFKQAIGARTPAEDEEKILGSTAPYLNRILQLQFSRWLPDNILTKQDKTSMASAIEARVPFLDHELVEFAQKLPPSLKIRAGLSKVVLRRYARRILPEVVTSRRKMPFYFPIEKSLDDPHFRSMVDDTLSERSIRHRGIFKPEAVASLLAEMRGGEFLVVKQVFSLVALELWFRMALDRRGAH